VNRIPFVAKRIRIISSLPPGPVLVRINGIA
jgi:hypothetical protein